jgi:hypothetical protein
MSSSSLLAILQIAKQGITHPFGDARSVKQAFPSGIPSKLSDPFLMCDYFDMKETKGPASHEDDFPIDWHPHRGFDIASYLKSGTGRHGDSLGNRETFSTPGMQWVQTGSGVEHAEGGATEKGGTMQGFQIWINVPAERKMDDPKYGTVPTEDLPFITLDDKVSARVLAGEALGMVGAFQTVQPIEMIDFELKTGATVEMDIGSGLDTAMIYVYEGSLQDLNGSGPLQTGSIALMDAASNEKRGLQMKTSSNSTASVILFAGKKLNEPIAWHGPIVMNTQQQIRETIHEIRTGQFPPKRVAWDYRRLGTKPKEGNDEL